MNQIDKLCIDTLRVLSAEMITKAKSGHPGIALGAAPIIHTLFTKELAIDPEETDWFNRDRFVLSAGHGSALLYAALHLAGFKITMDDLKQFRQKGSLTPGHPEYKHVPGVEMTTGPLGQGISSATGMAIAEKFLSSKFTQFNTKIINHYTYVLCGDGDLQEGVSQEAISLAGHLKLGKLIVLYDSNDIQLDGEVRLTNTEAVKNKYEAMDWQYLRVEDGNDIDEIEAAIAEAKEEETKPTLIEIKTIIGYGSPNNGESAVHGKPLSQEDILSLREYLEYDVPSFTVDPRVYDYYKENVYQRGANIDNNWNIDLERYSKKYPDSYKELNDFMYDSYTLNDFSTMPKYNVGDKESTRVTMGKVLDWINIQMPNTIGGSADLTPSTMVKGADGVFDDDSLFGRNIKFGVREHAMAAITNGINLHGGLRAFCAGFFVFSDYMKPAIRLAAIMKLNSLFFFSHDTVCVGEDGPTHQPVEQLTMMRSIPNLNVFRPADANEMTKAMLFAFATNDYPTVIVSSRQPLEVLSCSDKADISKGAYIAYEPTNKPTGIIIACGSELALAINVAKRLADKEEYVRVVSMPSMFLFEKASKEYQEKILPSSISKRLAIEMGSPMSWYKYSSNVFGIETFGASMPLNQIFNEYGFTEDNIYKVYNNIK